MRMKKTAAAAVLAVALTPCVAFAQPSVGDQVSAEVEEAVALEVVDEIVENDESALSDQVVAGEGASDAIVETEVAGDAKSELAAEGDKTENEAEAVGGVEGFVTRLYDIVLGRTPDPEGLAVQIEGVRAMGAGQIAFNFFKSFEFENLPLTNEARIEAVYKAMLDRSSDKEGKAMWVSYLNNGMSAGSVVAGFAESSEFANMCAEWGVEPGDVSALRSQLTARDQNPDVTAYVHRLYSMVLNRENPAGFELDYQCEALLNGMAASQTAMNFFYASEFEERGLSPEEAVRTAYLSMLDREPDEAGLAHWVSGFDCQMTIEGIVAGFGNSVEFKKNCDKWGVEAGTVEVKLARNKSVDITRAIYETYKQAFDRTPDPEGLDAWCEVCASRGLIWVCEGFLQSEEVAARATTNEERVALTYRVCLGREGDEEGIAGWTEYLDKGNNIYALLARFNESSEYTTRCEDLRVPGGKLLYFDVSTNHQLNMMIADIIQNVTGRDAFQCYLYVSGFTYKSRGLWPSYDGWMEDYAIKFIQDGGGNCYGYAALFAFLARACGYDTNVHQGMTTAARGGTTPHGWCEVYVDGKTLVVDPDCYHELGLHCYMLPYGSTPLTLYR